jgi:GDP-mannose 6-dehydrogenase
LLDSPHVSFASPSFCGRVPGGVALVVVGGSDPESIHTVASLYRPLGFEVSCASLRTAEMIKYCCNAFHALKIVFVAAIAAMVRSRRKR